MAVDLKKPDVLFPVPGIRLATAAAGIRYQNRTDLLLIEMVHGSRVGAVFTQNRFCAAPVVVAREHLQHRHPLYLLINAGNANAGMGETGIIDARATCRMLADRAGCSESAVLPFSTGVIGERLPIERFPLAIEDLMVKLSHSQWMAAAESIMTTDTVPKGYSECITLDGKKLTVTGIAKGSGMIHPDMATMLAFVATDAEIEPELLQSLTHDLVRKTFNRITVDGDTSTNDSCVLIATGASGVVIDSSDCPGYSLLYAALERAFLYLAQAIIRDGEGAGKFIEIGIRGASTNEEADAVAFTVAHSPLVKTALAAEDPNWGRILAAVGRAGIDDLDIARVKLYLGDALVFSNGSRDPLYEETNGEQALAGNDIFISIDLGRGKAKTRVWTTDLTAEYVRINADYRS